MYLYINGQYQAINTYDVAACQNLTVTKLFKTFLLLGYLSKICTSYVGIGTCGICKAIKISYT
jgi:hypothetical protein